MKRKGILLVLALTLFSGAFAQQDTSGKIDPELRKEMASRPGQDERFNIIIVMADEYDPYQMTRQTQYMDKAARRAYVIEELQRFSQADQHELKQLLDEGVDQGIVSKLQPFWIFNGIGCSTTREMIESLTERKDIGYIESDEPRNMLPENEKPCPVTEPLRGLAWHVSQVHANDVWNYNGSTGYDGTGVVVAIIDTGVNYNHADVADHMWDGGSQYPHHGYDYVNNDNDPMDDNGHGSHCAGITAGDGTSGTQTGIAPNATIMALKVLSSSGSGTTSARTNAQQFAMQNNADVVSMSLGSSGASGSKTDRQAFVNMMNAGIVASIAAGNDGEYYSSSHTTTNSYNQSVYYAVPKNVGSPGNCPPPWHNPDQTLAGGQSAVITIGASNRNDRKSTFSSFGPVTWYTGSSWSGNGYEDYRYQANSSTNIGLIKPDIIVPGTDITSLLYSDNSSYVEECGTSMATPLAAGIMALMLQANPSLTPAQIDEILETTALPVDYRITKNNYTGAGRGDALAAIDAICTQATKPTNLSLETCGGNVNLSWTASTAPAGYCIYRDNVQVGTTTETTYTDENVGAGVHVYYVRANDSNGHQSVRSSALLCTIEPYATVPQDLTIEWDGTHALLDWEASTASNTLDEATLCFSDNPKTAYGGSANSSIYWGMCFNPEELRPYQGMSIDQVSIPVLTTDISYTLRIYRGTTYGNTTGTPVYSQSFTPTSGDWEYQTMTLTTPYSLTDISQDLWITFGATLGSNEGYPAVVGQYDGPNSNCMYFGSGSNVNDMCWTHIPDYGSDYNYAVCIKAHLTRTTNYTPAYDVYLDNSGKASNLSADDYSDTPVLHSGDNTYYVTAKVGNNESCPSNEAKIVVIDDNQTADQDIHIDNSSVYLITPTGKWIANSIENTDPDRLILEDGAQLIHNSQNTVATVKKAIAAYSSNEDGWYFIASPVLESITPSNGNGLLSNDYDLYLFDQNETLEWRNYKANGFSTLDHTTGYLYANSGSTKLLFAGTLAPSADPTALTYSETASLKGFNLIGNPYPCNTTINRDYYIVNNNTIVLAENGREIAPCEGVFVKAVGKDESVVFNKAVASKGADAKDCFDLVVTKGNTDIDRARVRLTEGIGMEKINLDDHHSRIGFKQDGEEYAVAYLNGADALPLNFKAQENGTYTLAIEAAHLDLDRLLLIDHLTGARIDLLETPSYSFEAKTSDYPSRFLLVFNLTNDEEGNALDLLEGTVQLLDMTGRIVAQGDARQGISTTGLTPGVYILRTINGNDTKTEKIIIH